MRSVITQDLRVWKQAMIFNPVLRASEGGTLSVRTEPELPHRCHVTSLTLAKRMFGEGPPPYPEAPGTLRGGYRYGLTSLRGGYPHVVVVQSERGYLYPYPVLPLLPTIS